MSKLSTVIATLALAATAAASAQTTAPLTREAVIAELAAARSSGELAAIQGEKGVEVQATPGAKGAAGAVVRLPRQAVLGARATTEPVLDNKTAAALAADHGENAARELGDFPAPIVRRATAIASR